MVHRDGKWPHETVMVFSCWQGPQRWCKPTSQLIRAFEMQVLLCAPPPVRCLPTLNHRSPVQFLLHACICCRCCHQLRGTSQSEPAHRWWTAKSHKSDLASDQLVAHGSCSHSPDLICKAVTAPCLRLAQDSARPGTLRFCSRLLVLWDSFASTLVVHWNLMVPGCMLREATPCSCPHPIRAD